MKIGVIADDLTGANATGVRLTQQGFQAATMVHYEIVPSSDSYNAVCVDTDSRYASKEVAQERVRTALKNLQQWGAAVICKRIDSTVRGNIGAEIDTVLKELGEEAVAVVVASFPDSGRITSGGYLLVNGIPLQATDVANDPVMPLTQSYVPAIVQNQSAYPVAYIGLETVLAGEEKTEQAMREKIAEGKRILVVDAVTNEEIESIAKAMVALRECRMIPVDPGPLTAAYSKIYYRQHAGEKKIIVTVGSITTNAATQLRYLQEKTNAQPIYVDAKKLASFSDSWEEETERVIQAVLDEMKHQSILIITTNSPFADPLNLKEIAEAQGTTQDTLAKRITDGLGKITRFVIQRSPYEIGGCFTSGGDVTASLCALGRAEGIKLEAEVLPLVAYGHLIGGHLNGLPIITKGGLAGDKKAIYTSVQYLLAKS